MTKVNIEAEKNNATYSIPLQIDKKLFSIKFDTGAANTVISVDLFVDGISDINRNKIREYFENKKVNTRVFTSASGDEFEGYFIHSNDVIIDDESFSDFYYYLILENKRTIALLGDDFIENCCFKHTPHENIFISSFDDDSYKVGVDYSETAELMSYIDSL